MLSLHGDLTFQIVRTMWTADEQPQHFRFLETNLFLQVPRAATSTLALVPRLGNFIIIRLGAVCVRTTHLLIESRHCR